MKSVVSKLSIQVQFQNEIFLLQKQKAKGYQRFGGGRKKINDNTVLTFIHILASNSIKKF